MSDCFGPVLVSRGGGRRRRRRRLCLAAQLRSWGMARRKSRLQVDVAVAGATPRSCTTPRSSRRSWSTRGRPSSLALATGGQE